MATPENSQTVPTAGQWFATTHWSLVLTAGDANSPRSHEALERLCVNYWYPLYAYVRRQGYDIDEAKDLTQEFFYRLLAKNYLSAIDRRKGKFRSFLLASLEHFLAKERKRENAQKRGGQRATISFDEIQAEEWYRLEPAHDLTPEKLFERRWAMTLLDRAMQRLGVECAQSGKAELFELVQGVIAGEDGDTPYSAIAARLSLSEGALKVAVHRLRQRFGEILREEISQTVASPEELEQEVAHLCAALS